MSSTGCQASGINIRSRSEVIYKRDGLHHEGGLDSFWTEACGPTASVAQAFLQQLVGLTQVPCNLYGDREEPLLWTIENS